METSADTDSPRVSRSGRVLRKSSKLKEAESEEEARGRGVPATDRPSLGEPPRATPRQKRAKRSKSLPVSGSSHVTFVVTLKEMFEDVAHSVVRWRYANDGNTFGRKHKTHGNTNSTETQTRHLEDATAKSVPSSRGLEGLQSRPSNSIVDVGGSSSRQTQEMATGPAGRVGQTGKDGGIGPVDVAAHLKLLGGCMTLLGERVACMERDPPPSGVYSVLLDTLLCALGPLLCLTKQVAGLENVPKEPLAKTLDHIAYFLPGL